jgi:hypothetical protein
MDNSMLHHLAALQQQIDANEIMSVHLFEIQALFEPLLAGNLLDFPINKLHDYLGIASGLVDKVTTLNDQLISLLHKIRRDSLLV